MYNWQGPDIHVHFFWYLVWSLYAQNLLLVFQTYNLDIRNSWRENIILWIQYLTFATMYMYIHWLTDEIHIKMEKIDLHFTHKKILIKIVKINEYACTIFLVWFDLLYWHFSKVFKIKGCCYLYMVVGMDLQLSIQSVPIITKVVSSNPAHGKVY